MSSFNLIYNKLAKKYRGSKLQYIFADFENDYKYELTNNDEYGFQCWIDLVTPIFKKYYWDRINSYKRKSYVHRACEFLRLDGTSYLCKYL